MCVCVCVWLCVWLCVKVWCWHIALLFTLVTLTGHKSTQTHENTNTELYARVESIQLDQRFGVQQVDVSLANITHRQPVSREHTHTHTHTTHNTNYMATPIQYNNTTDTTNTHTFTHNHTHNHTDTHTHIHTHTQTNKNTHIPFHRPVLNKEDGNK